MPPDLSALERTLERFRRELLRGERSAASAMVRAYGAAWRRIRAELTRLDAEYRALRETGQQPGQAWIYQFGRLRSLQNQIERELSAYTQYVREAVRKEQEAAIYNAELHAERLVKSALGRMPAGVTIPWNRIPTGAAIEIIGATQVGSPLYQLLTEIAPRGAQAAIDALIQGLMLGKSPRETAREMRAALGGELWRSLRIARTETLRAYREATRLSYKANSDIVKGWVWHSALDQRTCAACWAMHGTEHTNDESLDDHPNGRCAMLPMTRSWAEIGEMYGVDLSDVPETNVPVERGGVLFGRLPREQQISILGPAKWAAWRDGLITFDDHPRTGIVGRTYNPVWGSMRAERSLRSMGLDVTKLAQRYNEIIQSL